MMHLGQEPVMKVAEPLGERYCARLVALPPALNTGNALIDDEHRQLLAVMQQLRKVCADPERLADCLGCAGTRRQACEHAVVGILGDLFAFILEHFASEERIMRDAMMAVTEHDLCAAHIEDHAAIAQKVQEIVSRLDFAHTVARIRELDGLLGRWLDNHIGMHDLILVGWLGKGSQPPPDAR